KGSCLPIGICARGKLQNSDALLNPKPSLRHLVDRRPKYSRRLKTMGSLAGKIAVVTGASKGIGASIADHLDPEGASVVVNYASRMAGADAVVKKIKDKGGKAIAVQADVSKPADITRLFEETKKAYGHVDILVNNAGIYEFSPLESVTPEHFHKQFNL